MNGTESALISATEGSKITLNGDVLSNEGIGGDEAPEEEDANAGDASRLGINSDSKSTVNCEGVRIASLSKTGCSVTGNSVLTFNNSTFEHIGECAIEAHDGAQLELTSCQFQSIGCIGVLIQKNVRGFLRQTNVTGCEIVGVHYIDNKSEFLFDGCQISQNAGTGVNLRGTSVPFTNCLFNENGGPGVEIRGSGTSPRFDACVFQANQLGISLSEGASPVFLNSTIKENKDAGIELTGGRGEFESCLIEGNVEGGIFASEQAVAKFKSCSITNNSKVGAQVDNQGTDISFEACDISLQSGSPGVGVTVNSQAVCRFNGCAIHENAGIQIQVIGDGKTVITGCQIYQSTTIGVGVNISKGLAEITSSTLYGETQGSIIIGEDGECTCSACDISQSGIACVTFLPGSRGNFSKNNIHSTASIGISVKAGTPSIVENTIENHEQYGIHIEAGAEPQVIDNVFNNNGVMDVFRA
jgi:parallel beta-helix repeat protein